MFLRNNTLHNKVVFPSITDGFVKFYTFNTPHDYVHLTSINNQYKIIEILFDSLWFTRQFKATTYISWIGIESTVIFLKNWNQRNLR